MAPSGQLGFDRTEFQQESAGILSGETAWVLRLTGSTGTLTETAKALGVDPVSVRAVGQSGVAALVRGSQGSARGSVAWCLAAFGKSPTFRQLDGRMVGAEKTLRDLLRVGFAAHESSTLFVDNYVALGETARAELLGQIATGRAPGKMRIILGAQPGEATGAAERCINVVEIMPLAARKRMIPSIMKAWLSSEKGSPRISDEAVRILKTWPWVGDMTELRILLDRLPLMRNGPIVTADQLGELLCSDRNPAEEVRRPLADVEREHILRVLDAQNWNRTQTAHLLGIDVKTLYNKLKRYEALHRP